MRLCQLTLAPYSSILTVPTWTAENGTTWAVSEVILIPSTVNTIQVNGASTSTEMSVSESHCICWYRYVNIHCCKRLIATKVLLNLVHNFVDTACSTAYQAF